MLTASVRSRVASCSAAFAQLRFRHYFDDLRRIVSDAGAATACIGTAPVAASVV